MIKRIILVLALTMPVPIAGYLITQFTLADITSSAQLEPGVTVEMICAHAKSINMVGMMNSCSEAGIFRTILIRDLSVGSGVVAVLLMGIYLLTSILVGKNRNAIAAIFPKLVPFSSLVIAALVFVQGALVTYAVFHFWIWAALFVGIGAIWGGFSLVKTTLALTKDTTHSEFAKNVLQSESPKLWEFVKNIADKVGAKPPDNIVVGLEPNFYVTAANVVLIGRDESLKGETLYLSTCLMRVFDKSELTSVIGHELGHFSGEDTAYSLKFAPIYRGLGESIQVLSEGEDASFFAHLPKLPAIAMLSLMYEAFAVNERKISREREFAADTVGVSTSSKESLATALAKVAVYAPLWSGIQYSNIQRLNERKVSRNLSNIFQDSARFDISHRNLGEMIEQVLQTELSHPTDTHPTILERYENIGYESDDLTVDDLTKIGSSIREVLDDSESIEEELSMFEHQFMVAIGQVTPPEETEDNEDDGSEGFLNAMYSLAASMVGADGQIVQSEVVHAEQIGSELFDNFDKVEFREHCNNLEDIPKFNDVVAVLGPALREDHKMSIYDYLKQIAMADDDLAEEEKELLVHLRKEWGLEI